MYGKMTWFMGKMVKSKNKKNAHTISIDNNSNNKNNNNLNGYNGNRNNNGNSWSLVIIKNVVCVCLFARKSVCMYVCVCVGWYILQQITRRAAADNGMRDAYVYMLASNEIHILEYIV